MKLWELLVFLGGGLAVLTCVACFVLRGHLWLFQLWRKKRWVSGRLWAQDAALRGMSAVGVLETHWLPRPGAAVKWRRTHEEVLANAVTFVEHGHERPQWLDLSSTRLLVSPVRQRPQRDIFRVLWALRDGEVVTLVLPDSASAAALAPIAAFSGDIRASKRRLFIQTFWLALPFVVVIAAATYTAYLEIRLHLNESEGLCR